MCINDLFWPETPDAHIIFIFFLFSHLKSEIKVKIKGEYELWMWQNEIFVLFFFFSDWLKTPTRDEKAPMHDAYAHMDVARLSEGEKWKGCARRAQEHKT